MNRTNPKVTVGIPVFNGQDFIRLAVKSVLNQTYSDFELIITDDGSTDDSVKIIQSFDDPRIRIISDGENMGISFRLNQQISLAKGEFFIRMDADDIMMPDRIERQIKYLEKHPDVDLIGGAAIIIDNHNKIIGDRHSAVEKRLTLQSWLVGDSFIHPTVAGKISFFQRHMYESEYKGIEDQDLWFRASQDSVMVQLAQYYIFYRDPLSFKLNTYLFRRKQNRKFWRSKKVKETVGKSICRKMILKCYIKSVLSIIANYTGTSKIIISRRNKVNGNIDQKYQNYINSLQ